MLLFMAECSGRALAITVHTLEGNNAATSTGGSFCNKVKDLWGSSMSKMWNIIRAEG